MQRRLAAVGGVQVANPAAQTLMERLLEQVPVQAGVMVPLAPLAELAAHEEELLAGLRVHPAEEEPEVGELLPVIAGHLVDQGALAVDDLVVRERQDEALVEG